MLRQESQKCAFSAEIARYITIIYTSGYLQIFKAGYSFSKKISLPKCLRWAISNSHMQQNACYRNVKWIFEDLRPCYWYAINTNSRTIHSQVPQPASADKGADMNEMQVDHCMLHHTRTANVAHVHRECHNGK